jgi:hypothetical protein
MLIGLNGSKKETLICDLKSSLNHGITLGTKQKCSERLLKTLYLINELEGFQTSS